jgi:2'-5' RNA ligase
MIRAFLAIRPTLDVIQGLLTAQAELDDAGADVRWVSAEAVHLTIQFLGDVRESEIPQIEGGLREQLGSRPSHPAAERQVIEIFENDAVLAPEAFQG